MLANIRTLTLAAAGAVICSASANAASDATGIWFDHNGRGAVEIAPCASGNGLCGYVVHIKDTKNSKRCGTQILGNVTSDGGGWIYSPDRGKKYSVELSRLSDDKLQVVGNAGSFFSKTYTWLRAPDDIARCGETEARAPAPAEPVNEPVKKKVAEKAPAPAPVEEAAAEAETYSSGSSSPSVALMAPKKKKRVAEAIPVATETATDASPEPAVIEKKTPAKTVATEQTEAPVVEEESFVPERKCKFTIPYVGRVIDVPCRD